jgi:hypothetical protein
MPQLDNFFRKSRLLWLVVAPLAMQASHGANLAYRVTVNGSRPVAGAYVTLQTRGAAKTIVTKTDESGKFIVPGVNADKVLMTIEKNGRIVYRGIHKVDSVPGEKVIDLTERNPRP